MIKVLAHKELSKFLPTTVEIFTETREQISFNLTSRQFKTLYDELQKRGLNPFAVMAWENEK